MAFDQSNYLYPLNRSMVNLKLERWDEAEADATKTLELYPHNLKALFRRGKARKELGKWDQAREDIQMFFDNEGDPTLAAQELKAIADAESSPPSEPSSYTPSDLDSGLANLHLQGDSSLFAIHTSATVQNGKGAFATRDIQKGDLILSEKPIFSFLTNTPKYGHVEAAAVCVRASRFNHSCSPNAWYSFNSDTGELEIHALGTIPRGKDIFVAYIGSRRVWGSSRRSRQAILRTRSHFTCACSICSLPDAESKMSDARRQKVNELWEIAGTFTPTQADQCFDVVLEAMPLLWEEGYDEDVVAFINEAGPMSPT
ncbi:hypothetical protein V8E53_013297 [Lactarius tabidus]